MDAFHGLRVLATVWVITIHTHIYVDKPLFDNIDELYRMSATWMRQFIVNASMSVCMFFTIGFVLIFVQSRKGNPR
ncbi:hypothetical protein IscW_ISCW022848 [Ixodes scapularis]|uniref:Acyltransferase 3 domain-containing protein n=1 Tax=Ixodes scapularis TaxID=6945 RepID=B7QBK3_IXOSC|nr:hypothetical protein IscW_ISCW022848 [Ixodes scapularis]|eukprot:XP_002412929.1 hypothetical protein IscW_ISCW022848 [Ixodes scapularis]